MTKMHRLMAGIWLLANTAVYAAPAPKKPLPPRQKPTTVVAPRQYEAPYQGPYVGIAANMGYSYLGIGTGIELWGNIGRAWQLGLNYQITSATLTDKERSDALLSENLDTKMTMTGVYGRYFIWESFYTAFSVNSVNYAGKYGYRAGAAGMQDTFVDYTAKANLMQIAIGNQWRLNSGHTLGVDWIGYGYVTEPHATLGNDPAASDGSTVKQRVAFFENQSVEDRLQRTLKEQMLLYALTFRLGMEF